MKKSSYFKKSSFALVLGILLGILSKFLDELPLIETTWYYSILNFLDLGNFLSDLAVWLFIALSLSIYSENPFDAGLKVFFFFLGLCISYHLSTIILGHFNPFNYMLIWYGLTLLSPILAVICWYSKKNNKISILLSTTIKAIMLLNCFGIGFWYFDFRNILYTLCFIGTIIILHKNYKLDLIEVVSTIIFAFIMRIFI